MNVNLIGSNGSLASSIGRYCNQQGHHLNVFGRSVPQNIITTHSLSWI